MSTDEGRKGTFAVRNKSAATTSASKEHMTTKKRPLHHLIAGGTAGFVESSFCHPLDTIKTRMQLRRQTTIEQRALSSMRDAEPSIKALHIKSSSSMKETVRIKPNVTEFNLERKGQPLHDVGWKQRVTYSTSTVTTAEPLKNISRAVSTSTAAASPAPPVSHVQTVVAPMGPFGTARRIIQREGPLALYKGLTAVYTGIVPKMFDS